MMLMAVLCTVSLCAELLVPWLPVKREWLKTVVAASSTGLLVALSVCLVARGLGFVSLAFGVLGIYRMINLLRILKGRIRPAHLGHSSLLTTGWLAGAQIVVLLVGSAIAQLNVAPGRLLVALAAMQCLVAIVLLQTVRGHARRSLAVAVKPGGLADKDLPTITVAIAARNETESLVQCLESVISSNYPKLEILVLDDCSQTRKTPDIIRSFAQAGVRFVPGAEPAANWLARNQAYDTLAKAASGDYILFASTSLRLSPQSIRQQVAYVTAHHKTMLSVLPLQTTTSGLSLIEPVRAAWELLPPRRWFNRPPIASAHWLVQKTALLKAGGFAGVSRMVLPEAYFAKRFSANDGYSFLVDGGHLGIGSTKTVNEQRAKALRVLYPGVHRRPEMVVGLTVILLASCVLPFVGVFAVVLGLGLVAYSLLSLVAVVIWVWAYAVVLRLCYGNRANIKRAALGFPVAIVWLLALLHRSLYDYEFGTVLWKDRNICLPVMHAQITAVAALSAIADPARKY